MSLALLILLLAFAVSMLSGLLGIGGGIVMAPVLLYVPPLLGMDELSMSTVAGLTITQGLAASLSGVLRHNKYRQVNRRLVAWMGSSIAVWALAGAIFSRWLSGETLLALFAGLALAAAIMMFLPTKTEGEVSDAGEIEFNVPWAVAIASCVGFLGGIVGQGGSFLLIPAMLHKLRIPIRVVIASNLGIVFFSSLAGFAGKFATEQVPGLLALYVVLGALPAAQLGSVISHRTPPPWLRRSLALVVALAALAICVELFHL